MHKAKTYWVFHGKVYLPPEPRTASYVNATIAGYGKAEDEALEDAERRAKKRWPGGRLTAIAHVSGPWKG